MVNFLFFKETPAKRVAKRWAASKKRVAKRRAASEKRVAKAGR